MIDGDLVDNGSSSDPSGDPTSCRATGSVRGQRARRVILDAGTRAWLVTVEPGLGIGSRLYSHGQSWVITQFREHGNAFVAVPVAH